MAFTADLVRQRTINPIADQNLDRVANALNGLTDMFGERWINRALYHFDPYQIAMDTGIAVDLLLSRSAEYFHLTSLWEDLVQLSGLPGATVLQEKLRRGLRDENVDLEISIAADFVRLVGEVQLEPDVKGGRKADLRLKLPTADRWTYAEVTRKSGGKPAKLTKDRGKTLAGLVAARDPTRRHYISLTRKMTTDFTDDDFAALTNWIPSSKPSDCYQNWVYVGTVAHNEDESLLAMQHLSLPVNVIQDLDWDSGAFGVAYLFIPDLGAEKKIYDKSQQAMSGEESVLFVDLTSTGPSDHEWEERIPSIDEARHFSAVVTLRNEQNSHGFSRRCRIIEIPSASTPLTLSTRDMLLKFSDLRFNRSLT